MGHTEVTFEWKSKLSAVPGHYGQADPFYPNIWILKHNGVNNYRHKTAKVICKNKQH